MQRKVTDGREEEELSLEDSEILKHVLDLRVKMACQTMSWLQQIWSWQYHSHTLIYFYATARNMKCPNSQSGRVLVHVFVF